MAWKFFNIGKANAEIDRLTSELSDKQAGPAATTSQLSEALASNDAISADVSRLTSELATAKSSLATANTALEKAQGEVNALGAKLKAACASLKLEIKDGATGDTMIESLSNGVASTLAKLNVKATDIPASRPATNAGGDNSKTKTMAQYRQMAPGEAQAFFRNGGNLVD